MDGTLDGNGAEASADAGAGCFLNDVGVYGQCVATSACTALADHIFHASVPGYCSGRADIGCCTRTPNVADNPPIPVGWKLLPQAAVTPDMTTWAISILKDPTGYPVHRGVTLYEPG
jgi:hypothetical protein